MTHLTKTRFQSKLCYGLIWNIQDFSSCYDLFNQVIRRR